MLEPEKVEENMIGQDYHGIKVRIKIIFQMHELDSYFYSDIKEFDSNGDFPSKFHSYQEKLNDIYKHFGVDENSYMVCVEEIESGEKNIYPYGDHGVFVSAWKGSDKLKDLNKKTGLLEHLKSFKMFKNQSF